MIEFLEKELEIVLWSFWYQSSDWLHMKHSFLQVSNEFMWGNFVIVQIYVWWPVDCFNTSLQSRDLNLVVGWKFVSLQWQHYFKLFSSFFNSVYYIHANKHVNVCNITRTCHESDLGGEWNITGEEWSITLLYGWRNSERHRCHLSRHSITCTCHSCLQLLWHSRTTPSTWRRSIAALLRLLQHLDLNSIVLLLLQTLYWRAIGRHSVDQPLNFSDSGHVLYFNYKLNHHVRCGMWCVEITWIECWKALLHIWRN